MPTLDTYKGVYLWHYVPSLPAAIVFTLLFGAITGILGWRMFSTKMWFVVPFFIGGIFEVIGYIGRAACYTTTGQLGSYIVQSVFLLLAPVLFAATLYMLYTRVIRAVKGAHCSPISPLWTTRIFVLGDYSCFMIQGNAAGLLTNAKLRQVAEYIIIAGLGLQVILFGVFIVCCVLFNVQFRRYVGSGGAGVAADLPWQTCLNMLYATSLAIMVRNIYRLVEYIMGQDSYLFYNEWPVYTLDGGLMLFTMITFYIWYPTRLLESINNRDSMIELTSDGTHIEAEQSAKAPDTKYGAFRNFMWGVAEFLSHGLLKKKSSRAREGRHVARR